MQRTEKGNSERVTVCKKKTDKGQHGELSSLLSSRDKLCHLKQLKLLRGEADNLYSRGSLLSFSH